MGRISKRVSAAVSVQTEPAKEYYRAGIYARLSSAQDTKKNESIDAQVRIAEKYIEELNKREAEQIDIIDRYIDLGKTGSNFNRDEFKRLMQDIRFGSINCVIVKDLSRFGRNYLEAGNYIEKIFPFLGVRFIAIADGFDTGNGGNDTEHMAVEIKNLVNDMYAKDFSAKARQQLKKRREEGSYVGGAAPYGYIVAMSGGTCQGDKKVRKLLPDEKTAEIVRDIYERFVRTESYSAVADDLNSRKINPPYVYKKTGEVFFAFNSGGYKGWDKSAVKRILKSETYIGKLVQGKTSVAAGNEKNRVHKNREEWVIHENAHEPLVDGALFKKAEKIREKFGKTKVSHRRMAEKQRGNGDWNG